MAAPAANRQIKEGWNTAKIMKKVVVHSIAGQVSVTDRKKILEGLPNSTIAGVAVIDYKMRQQENEIQKAAEIKDKAYTTEGNLKLFATNTSPVAKSESKIRQKQFDELQPAIAELSTLAEKLRVSHLENRAEILKQLMDLMVKIASFPRPEDLANSEPVKNNFRTFHKRLQAIDTAVMEHIKQQKPVLSLMDSINKIISSIAGTPFESSQITTSLPKLGSKTL